MGDVDTRVNTLISYQNIHIGNNKKFITAPCSSSLNEKQRFIVVEEDEINTEPTIDLLEEESSDMVESSDDLPKIIRKKTKKDIKRMLKAPKGITKSPNMLKS